MMQIKEGDDDNDDNDNDGRRTSDHGRSCSCRS
jgi:hypothetical protein